MKSNVLIERPTQQVTTPILESAVKIAKQAEVSLPELKKRFVRIVVILVVGIIGSVMSVAVIISGGPQGEPGRVLAAFSLLVCLGIILAAGLGLSWIKWNMYIYRYVQRLDGIERAAREDLDNKEPEGSISIESAAGEEAARIATARKQAEREEAARVATAREQAEEAARIATARVERMTEKREEQPRVREMNR
jgi:hypothetical protein